MTLPVSANQKVKYSQVCRPISVGCIGMFTTQNFIGILPLVIG